MSYGHRLNVEQIYFSLAEDHFTKAAEMEGKVRHRDPGSDTDLSFAGYPTAEGLAAASIAIVSYAIALESFVNLIWNSKMRDRIPSKALQQMAIKQLSTVDKTKDLLNLEKVDVGTLPWWPHIIDLYQVRNQLVHYKDIAVYQGFSFASPIALTLSAKALHNFRSATISCIETLGSGGFYPTDFVKGSYEFETILTLLHSS